MLDGGGDTAGLGLVVWKVVGPRGFCLGFGGWKGRGERRWAWGLVVLMSGGFRGFRWFCLGGCSLASLSFFGKNRSYSVDGGLFHGLTVLAGGDFFIRYILFLVFSGDETSIYIAFCVEVLCLSPRSCFFFFRHLGSQEFFR